MPDLLTNTTGTIQVYLETEGAPLTGRAVLVSVLSPRNATLVSLAPTVEVSPGWYRASLDADALTLAGSYTAVWESAGSPAIEVTTTFTVGYIEPGTPTLAQIRLRVARELGGLLYRGQAAAGSTATAIVDPALVWGGDGQYAGGFLVPTSGQFLGQSRRITDSDASSTTLTVAPAWIAPLAVGDRYVVLADDPATIDDAINDGIRSIGAWARLLRTDESLTTIAGQAEYPVPPGFTGLCEVRIGTADDDWLSIPTAEWEMVPGGHFRLSIAPASNDLPIQVAGIGLPSSMESDAQYAEVRPEFLVVYASEALHAEHGGGQVTDPDDHRRVQTFYAQRHEVERKRAIGRIPHNHKGVMP